MTGHREHQLVELVSSDGSAVGSATVAQAHAAPGLLHRAFSVLLFNAEGATLLQQRSSSKTRFPLRWANSCCGHPAPEESIFSAATKRLAEELGVSGVDLVEVGVYAYTAADATTGRVEREYDHVVLGQVTPDAIFSPDLAEVAAIRWAPALDLGAEIAAAPEFTYAPWLTGVLNVAIASGRVSLLP